MRERARSNSFATFAVTAVAAILTLHAFFLLAYGGNGLVRANLILQLTCVVALGVWSHQQSRTLLNPTFIFITSVYFWHSTFLTGYFFSLSPIFEYTGNILSYGEEYIPRACALVALCIGFTVLGAVASVLRKPAATTHVWLDADRFVSARVAWAFFGLITLAALCYLLFEAAPRFSQGYLSQYVDEAPETRLYRFYHSTKFLGVLAILLIFQCATTRRLRVAAIAGAGSLIFLNTVTGSRSMPFLYGLTTLVCIDQYVRHIPTWSLIPAAIFGSAASFILDHTRAFGLGLKVFDFKDTGLSVNYLHVFWNCGGVVKTLLRTMSFTAHGGVLYGQSFFDAFVSLIPTPIWRSFGLSLHLFRPSEWLVQNSPDVNFGEGLGYSLVGEAYLNFGLAGCALFFMIGFFLASGFFNGGGRFRQFGHLHVLNFALLLSLHMRNDFATYFRIFLWGALLIEILRYRAMRSVRSGVLQTVIT